MHRVRKRGSMVEKKIERRPIVGYEGYYEVDCNGNVYSLDRVIEVNDHGRVYKKPIKGRVLSSSQKDNGYVVVGLLKHCEHKHEYVHRLVAQAFLPNPDNLPCINHKDENRANNNVDNLEWCSYYYNLHYNDAHLRMAEKKRGQRSPKRLKLEVNGVTKDIIDWSSECGVKPSTIKKRLWLGWSPEEAVTPIFYKSRFERKRKKAERGEP